MFTFTAPNDGSLPAAEIGTHLALDGGVICVASARFNRDALMERRAIHRISAQGVIDSKPFAKEIMPDFVVAQDGRVFLGSVGGLLAVNTELELEPASSESAQAGYTTEHGFVWATLYEITFYSRPSTLDLPVQGRMLDLAVHGEQIAWIDDRGVVTATLGSKVPPRVLATYEEGPLTVAIDKNYAYWSVPYTYAGDKGPSTQRPGFVARTPVEVGSGPARPQARRRRGGSTERPC